MQTKIIPYTFNRSGYFYFSRRISSDLLQHYTCARIVHGLRTKSSQTAKARALVAAAKLDQRWSQLRLAHSQDPGTRLPKTFSTGAAQDPSVRELVNHDPEHKGPSLADALDMYRSHKGKGRGKTFHTGE